MERILTLLRHGEAATGHGQREDYNRTLTEHGVSQLTRLRKVLEEQGISFDLTLYSPAKRTIQTMKILEEGLDLGVKIPEKLIYSSSLGDLVSLVQGIPNTYQQVLLVGHNPAISHLQGFLSGDLSILFSPGMMVRLSIEADGWNLISRSAATVIEVMQ